MAIPKLEELQRSSLGRIAFIGELYNVRDESLSSLSVFKGESLNKLITKTDINQTDFKYKFTETISDRFELLNVEADIQVSVLCGLVKVGGSGNFLSEEKKSGKTVSCSIICQFRTIHERLFGGLDDYISCVDLSALKNPEFTHMVSEIEWGANCLLNLDFTCDDKTHKKDLQGRLAADVANLMKIMLSVKGGGAMKMDDSSLFHRKDIEIKVNADILPESSWPTTVEGFCEFIKEVPKLMKNVNNGAGKPLKYVLSPLDKLREMAKVETSVETISKKIDESFVLSIVYLFEEIGEVKQQLQDFYTEMEKNRKYVQDEDFKKTGRLIKELTVKESELKLMISKGWVEVKSGQKELKDLFREVEKFKCRDLNLLTYIEYLDSCSSILNKISTVKLYLSQGILYLGKGDKFETVQATNPSHEFIVLVTSSEIEMIDPDLSEKTKHYFIIRANEKHPNTKYVVIDFDYREGKNQIFSSEITQIRCFHLKGSTVLSRDLFAEYLAEIEMNFARPKQSSTLELCTHKPGNRTVLEIPCPGAQTATCPSDSVIWNCWNCKKPIEYGFDDHFYCACGKNPFDSLDYRCKNPKHGPTFISAEQKFLKNALEVLRPLKEMNVVFLGQSGVGKSTFINSLVNYMSYETLDIAKDKGIICTIPIEITTYDPVTRAKVVIEIGKNSNSELDVGASVTQDCHTYSFIWKNTYVRIIDTPGLGDTRGIEQDKENLSKIIDHLGYLNEIHGVCILLKANDNRFGVLFSYCIKELLSHLHKSITKNIVFCFTNSRTSFYSPGQASAILERLIKEIGIAKELPLGEHNMFSFDNESFLFACSLKHCDMDFSDAIKASYVESWRISLNETNRLFDTVKTFKPHKLVETISLVKARNRVLSLSKPLVEISKTVQLKIAGLENLKKQISESELTLQELKKLSTFQEIQLETEQLKKPRTVCTSVKCVEYITYRSVNVREPLYKTHCHVECYLKGVTVKIVNNPLLKDCTAMNNGVCKVCGCGWQQHMHIMESQKRVEKTVVNEKIKKDIENEESEKVAKEKTLKEFSLRVEKLKNEQNFIIQASVKFGMFLKSNAIAIYNDSVSDYLKHLINEESKKPHKSKQDEEILESLRKTLKTYQTEVEILREVADKGSQLNEKMTVEDVMELEKKLFNLELMGEEIRKSVEATRSSAKRMMNYSETQIFFREDPGRPQFSRNTDGGTVSKLTKAVKTAFNKVFSSDNRAINYY